MDDLYRQPSIFTLRTGSYIGDRCVSYLMFFSHFISSSYFIGHSVDDELERGASRGYEAFVVVPAGDEGAKEDAGSCLCHQQGGIRAY